VFLILKDTSGFFQYVVVNLWCWASTIMPEASQKVAETAEITKTAPQTQPKSRSSVSFVTAKAYTMKQ